ncbi:sensor histidine kinase [Streptomyces acidiscabies]|uniref:histidine kinase n=1 Tax=Streptomyces acidiscabies TaxID=42234 RepID=A0AAP6BC41_9ACTN|nr:HAMP domain-containing sensor histidine kinase [Streptomyces acidiscabies]MBP5942693.1 HAMP domain-containing histidine kinase [Streptomyces sp. LBUM 1476]MBZ3917970.1 HAMP domain-containing histidine kinase [Streptomyces acidiscabies]MDX2961944.1 HAMP domain-containing sensor histidine kinase [Streptomyces acidiscabies]MDX3021828.1 HAMP domain-containing sensor histidine kinase [Streptomyces acidiscabies]MDX3789485.1 HAMP domain-containing sensor histidine kinase [Streptomyces acidiscabies
MTPPWTPRPRSMRGRLVWGVTLLAVVVVLTSQVIGVAGMRSWLLQRVDRQLRNLELSDQVFAPATAPVVSSTPGAITLPSDFRVTFYDAWGAKQSTLGGGDGPGPQLASSIGELGLKLGHVTTVPAESGGGRWRVLRRESPELSTYVVALPFDSVQAVLSKQLVLSSVILVAAVAVLLVVGRAVVRLALLPLTRMERTAQGIIAGDLGLRLSDTDPRTETGRLGTVLNDMLDRLQQAMRQREFSEERLRRFVADAGHELRTPLTTVQGFAQLALRHPDRPAAQRREADEQLARNAERMHLLIDDLLLLAKLDQEPAYRSDPVDLLCLAADAVSAAAVRAHGEHRVTLSPLGARTEDAELEVVETVGDPDRLLQVVGNLLSNALVHTPPGTPVDVRVGTTLADGTPVAVIEVADRGPGLAPADAERVFERFYRADPSRSRPRGGNGLGLAIASAIAQGHGGRVELDTAPGEGCTFRLVLPLSRLTGLCP